MDRFGVVFRASPVSIPNVNNVCRKLVHSTTRNKRTVISRTLLVEMH